MERSSKRGKIPQQDWRAIIKRYEAGETLASIARTYGCSPPAISYILSRSRARDTTAESGAPGAGGARQPQLLKSYATEMSAVAEGETNIGEHAASTVQPPAAGEIERLSGEPPPHEPPSGATAHATYVAAVPFDRGGVIVVQEAEGNGAAEGRTDRAAANGTSPGALGSAGELSQNGEPRRTLHLSLSQEDPRPALQPNGAAGSSALERAPVRSSGGQQHDLPPPSGQPNPALDLSAANGGAASTAAEPHRTPERAKDGGAFIDQALRARVEGDITAFLAAFDTALAHDTLESRTGLREATDRLLRAGARTRIELERLEARMPLAVRDSRGHPSPTWRPR